MLANLALKHARKAAPANFSELCRAGSSAGKTEQESAEAGGRAGAAMPPRAAPGPHGHLLTGEQPLAAGCTHAQVLEMEPAPAQQRDKGLSAAHRGCPGEHSPEVQQAPQRAPHQVKFPLAVQIWPLRTCAAFFHHQALVTALSRGEQKWRLPAPAEKLCHGKHADMCESSEVECLCRSASKLCR